MKTKIVLLFMFGNQVFFAQDSIVYNVYFQFKMDTIDFSERQLLKQFLSNFEKYKITGIVINGYCDDIGTIEKNNILSQNRADSLRSFLMQYIPQDTSRYIYAKGRGEVAYNPLDNEFQRNQNRRGEIKIYYKKNIAPIMKNKRLQQFFSQAKRGDKLKLKLFFGGSSHLLLPSSTEELNELYMMMNASKIKIDIQGHICCESDSTKDGYDYITRDNKLSENRAKEVFEQLVKRGIDHKRMTYKGLGVRFPTRLGPSHDRRVEIEVLE